MRQSFPTCRCRGHHPYAYPVEPEERGQWRAGLSAGIRAVKAQSSSTAAGPLSQVSIDDAGRAGFDQESHYAPLHAQGGYPSSRP